MLVETWLLCEVCILWFVQYPECIRSQCAVLQIESIQKEYEQEMEQAQEEFEVSISMVCTCLLAFIQHTCTHTYVDACTCTGSGLYGDTVMCIGREICNVLLGLCFVLCAGQEAGAEGVPLG